jgi:DNA-binding transcriptional MocR family regulator
MLMKTASQSLADQLSTRFAERIRTRLLAPGARLPSVRQCAQQQGVSPSTVVAAYDQLLAQGLVEARKNRGFYVREMAVAPEKRAQDATHSGASLTTQSDLQAQHVPVNATALIRGMFHRNSELPQPGMGAFPPDWMETSFMPAAVRKVTSGPALQSLSLQYGEPAGDSGLRQALAQKLAAYSVQVAPGQIVTTVGATHALDIVSRTLLRAGDYVMVEEPGWAIEFARLGALGMRILPVPRRADGPDLEVMARYCQLHAPKLFVSVSVLHNPTGYCLTPGSAHRVLQLANAHNFYIVEDDTYSHIAPDHATRLCALDGLQRTIYVSGFAKILAPGWRVGFLAAPPALVEAFVDTKTAGDSDDPSLAGKGAGLVHRPGPAAPPRRAHPLPAGPGPRAQRQAGAVPRLQLCRTPGGLVWLGGNRGGYGRAVAAHAGCGLSAGARGTVPRRTPAQHPDAHQLCDHAGRTVLGRV